MNQTNASIVAGPFGIFRNGLKKCSRIFGWFALAGIVVVAGGCSGGPKISNPLSSANNNELLFVSAAPTWDMNKDNTVSCQEWKQYTAELFQTADGNSDGVLTAEEYEGVIKQDRLFQVATMSFFDSNKDGKLTAQEMADTPNPAFKILDRDKNCEIARNELVHTRQVQNAKKADDSIISGGADPGGMPR